MKWCHALISMLTGGGVINTICQQSIGNSKVYCNAIFMGGKISVYKVSIKYRSLIRVKPCFNASDNS